MTEDEETLDVKFNALKVRMKVLTEELKTFSPFIDSVQIFCTAYDPEKAETYSFEEGVGSMFTRLGVTQDFCNQSHFEDM